MMQEKEGGPADAADANAALVFFFFFFFPLSPVISLLLLNVQLERGFLGKVPADGL